MPRLVKYVAPGVVVIALSVGAFIGAVHVTTSHADAPIATLPADLPVASLPPVAVDAATAAQLESSHIANVNQDVLGQARKLADTADGPLYALPDGKGGVCVALAGALACGSPDSSPEKMVAITAPDQGGNLVGGGVLAAGVGRVNVSVNSTSKAAPLVPGGFTIGGAQDLPAGTKTLSFTSG